MKLTKLEVDVIVEVYISNGIDCNITEIENYSIESRRNTGVGRYVNFPNKAYRIQSNSGGLSSDKIALMEQAGFGIGFTLFLDNGYLHFLEMYTYGDDAWDGNEYSYKIDFPNQDNESAQQGDAPEPASRAR